jgi:hypothetical protein
MSETKPLSTLVAQGWEVVGYAAGTDAKSGVHNHSILLRRQKQHRILQVRKKVFGKGQVATEIDL